MRSISKEGYRLLHEGALALSAVEAAGMRVDVSRLDASAEKVKRRIARLEDRLRSGEEWKAWKGRFGDKSNLGSRQQLGIVLFDLLGHRCRSRTRTGRPATDVAALESVDSPFVRTLLEVEKLKKLLSTYIRGIRREVVDGFLHPSFNLHLVRTFRSSSDSPNFQNIPIRDKRVGKVVRNAFVPRPGRMLVEVDYSALEVRVSACYHRDPTMMRYIEDGYDLHCDMAAECYALPKSQVTKDVRFYAKNQFVFPEFYGDYYANCARNLWDAIDKGNLTTADGVSLKEHLASKGMGRFGAFERHIKNVEMRFWDDRFPVYRDWKDEWMAKYLRRGWMPLKTGFVCQGVYRRNEVINYPVQGSAFHCLLWSLIRIVRWLRKKKMKSLVVGQIHDSMLLDVTTEELDDVIGRLRYVMTRAIRKAWPWIIVPLEVEMEGSSENWYTKEPIG